MRDYGKVFSRIWESADFRSLSEDGRTLVLYLLTCQHGTIAGVFRVPDGYACEDLQWTAERVSEGFRNLCEKGFATRCEGTKWVWLHKFLEHNPPENPNQRKAAAKIALSVPDQCTWKLDFMRVWGEFLGLPKPEEKNPSATVPEPFLNQYQEQYQEQKKEDGENDVVVLPCPQQEIIDAYHRLLPTGRRVREWTPARAAILRARWREKPKRQTLEWWEKFFAYCAESDFLTGKVHTPGRKPFELSLDWLVKAENMAKVIEGAYENEREAA